MKVRELIEKLSNIDPELDIIYVDGDDSSQEWCLNQETEVKVETVCGPVDSSTVYDISTREEDDEVKNVVMFTIKETE